MTRIRLAAALVAVALLSPQHKAAAQMPQITPETEPTPRATPGTSAGTAASRGATEATNVRLVEDSFAAWAAGTGGPYDLLAADARWTIEGNSLASRTYPSREAFLSEVIRPFNARMTRPLKPTIRGIYADGDTVVVLFDARGTARDGRPYANSYAWFLAFRDGRIVRANAFFDAHAFDDFWSRVTPAP